MRKDKLKHLPENLIWGAFDTWFVFGVLISVVFPTLTAFQCILSSFYIYIYRAVNQTDVDCLEEKIKKLEKLQGIDSFKN